MLALTESATEAIEGILEAPSIPDGAGLRIAPLAHLLTGALDEAAMYVARAERQLEARAEMGEALGRIPVGLAAR